MSVYFRKPKKNSKGKGLWICETKKLKTSYSVIRYGKYAKPLAELSEKTNERYKNIYIFKEEYTTLVLYSNKDDKYYEFIIDNDDYEKVKTKTWSIRKCNGNIYAEFQDENKRHIPLHRFITNCPRDKVVDHKDRDTFNTRKSNLRCTTQMINSRNLSKRKNKIGFTGVIYRKEKNAYYVSYTDKSGVVHRKMFSINKYGKFKAYELAVKYRYLKCLENDYNTDEYIEFLKIKRVRVNKL